ncbi:MAG: WecB/TagA/CpsF family glycosyltransferase [Chloroflexi bacterium]|nr:WecB/TagA/CpsF family glycosyltransferase [Chloroflexota bacterium]MCY3937665.1 WecB/TagA/CpsF family glycosyltransferase [Chloroflexota bacterium]
MTAGADQPESVDLMGIPIATVRSGEAMAWIAAWAESANTRIVCTVNPEFIMRARRDLAFRQVLERSDMNVPDGIGIVAAARLARLPITERVAGVDLVQTICEQGSYREWRIFLLGGAPGVADDAAARLEASLPGLRIAGCSSASSDPRFDEATVAEINAARTQILLVAFGAPTQELWIERNLARLRCGVAMGVGGTLDYLSGRITRAPRLVGDFGLEWAFRLAMQPHRWRRMAVLPGFALLSFKEAIRRNGRPPERS